MPEIPPPMDQKAFTKQDLDEAVQHAVSRRDIKEIKDGLGALSQDFKMLLTTMQGMYVMRTEFIPVRNIVYGMVALILTGVTTALLALVIITR